MPPTHQPQRQETLVSVSGNIPPEHRKQVLIIGAGSVSLGTRRVIAAGLEAIAANTSPVFTLSATASKLEAQVAELRQRYCPTVSSGAAFAHEPADLDRAFAAGAHVVASPRGLAVLGEGGELLVLDTEARSITFLVGGQETSAALDLTALNGLAEALEGALATGRRAMAEGRDLSRPIGAEIPFDGLVLHVIAAGPGAPSLRVVDGPSVVLPSFLDFLRLVAEVRCLQVRTLAATVEASQRLEAQHLAAPVQVAP